MLLLALLVGGGVVSPRAWTGTWNGSAVLTAARPLDATADHPLSTPATAESVTGADDSSPVERDEVRWRHGPGLDPAFSASGVVPPVAARVAAAPDTDHDAALARAGRRSSWPTGPPVLSL